MRVKWVSYGIALTSPVVEDWEEVMKELTEEIERNDIKHNWITLSNASLDITTLVMSQIHETKINILEICDSPLSRGSLTYLHSLNHNQQLQVLWLQNCNLSIDGLKGIIQSSRSNSSLKELDLYKTPLTSDVIGDIIKLLISNEAIEKVKVDVDHKAYFEKHDKFKEVQNRIDFY
jgi:hypothetical protein